MGTPSPIKRDKNLVLLSRDHHDGLLLVWKIRQGIRLNINHARIAAYIINVFDKELEQHFIEEESLLFNKLHFTDELRIKAEDQHAAIRKKVAAFRSSGSHTDADLLSFASDLEEHIRFEERTFFPYCEKLIPQDVLCTVGKQLEVYHSAKECLVWGDEFWRKQ